MYAGFETVAHWNEASEDWGYSYYISVDEFIDVEVSREIWEELIGLLQEARCETPEPVTFEEFFAGIYVE